MTTHRMELGKRKIDNAFCLEQNAVNLERPTSGKRQAMKQLLKQEAEALLKVFQALPDNVHFRTPTLHLKGMLEQHMAYLVGLFKNGSLLVDGQHVTLTGQLFGEGKPLAPTENWPTDYKLVEIWVETVLLNVCNDVITSSANTVIMLAMWDVDTLRLLIKFTTAWLTGPTPAEHNREAFELVLLTLDHAWGFLTVHLKMDKLHDRQLKMGMLQDVREAIQSFMEKPHDVGHGGASATTTTTVTANLNDLNASE